ncbi:hypothetical protein Bcop_1364 [Bacteroides coprosuis DSM 18011]|uniref:Uncharacterized protein n=1 Tax=Bacteroides coprosuis DSM 18011 TaxID=679937 RepID=F3ZNY5_9BACE|nr:MULTISPECIES: hypothetical protein [Bacteroides]EGJ71561.1 hypothetical protein Bcop_1364 [Bacteroides coprosuis DSM 18011]HJD91455.1 hypothetical protein [Bacteroides coprosuis]
MKSIFPKIIATLLAMCLFFVVGYLILEITGALEFHSYRESSVPCVVLFIAFLFTLNAIWRKRGIKPENKDSVE